jgi:hypothetical protein
VSARRIKHRWVWVKPYSAGISGRARAAVKRAEMQGLMVYRWNKTIRGKHWRLGENTECRDLDDLEAEIAKVEHWGNK